MTFCLEANLACGKSTICNMLSNLLPAGSLRVVQEPLTAWQNYHGVDVLTRLYNAPGKYSFFFQSLVQLGFLKHALAARPPPVGRSALVEVQERSIHSSLKVFVELASINGHLSFEEKCLLEDWHQTLISSFPFPPYHFIYISVPAEVCFERMKKRNRSAEADVSLDYLKAVEKLHDAWLLNCENATVIDGNRPIEVVANDVLTLVTSFNSNP